MGSSCGECARFASAICVSSEGGQRLLNPRHDAFFAENLEQVVEAGAGGLAGHSQPAGMHQRAGFHVGLGVEMMSSMLAICRMEQRRV